MIDSGYVQFRHRRGGGYLARVGPPAVASSWAIVPDPRDAAFARPADAAALAARQDLPVAVDQFDIVPAAACGCCGRWASYGDYPRSAEFRPVAVDQWRCDKHVGRAPCLVEGCGRTFALDGAPYEVEFICGKHWRQAPKRMRDAVARVRRAATKRDWPDDLLRRYTRLWNRTVRTVREGRTLDEREINAMFGWSED